MAVARRLMLSTYQYKPDSLYSLYGGGEQADAPQPQRYIPETEHQ